MNGGLPPGAGMNVEVNPNEDTEWNDILRQHGVIPEKPPSPTAQLEEAMEQAVQDAYDNRLEKKTLEELEELDEEGLEDEDFIEMYRRKRMAELKDMASREKFGEVKMISKPEYKEEITDASQDDTFVFVHISYPGVTQSKLLSGLFDRLAPKFKDLKFVSIDARQINDQYPSDNCPTILVYKNTNVIKQIVTLRLMGGNSCNIKDVEKVFIDVGAIKETDARLTKNQEEEEEARNGGLRQSSIRSRRNMDSDSEDDDY